MAAPSRKKSKRNYATQPRSIGEMAEDTYYGVLKGIGRFLLEGAKQVLDSNFGKGMLITAAVVIGVMAFAPGLVPVGVMSSYSLMMPQTAAAGIGNALAVLSPIGASGLNYAGMATLAGGGLVGRYALPKLFNEAPTMNAKQAQRKAEKLGISASPQLQQDMPEMGPKEGMDETHWRTAARNSPQGQDMGQSYG